MEEESRLRKDLNLTERKVRALRLAEQILEHSEKLHKLAEELREEVHKPNGETPHEPK